MSTGDSSAEGAEAASSASAPQTHPAEEAADPSTKPSDPSNDGTLVAQIAGGVAAATLCLAGFVGNRIPGLIVGLGVTALALLVMYRGKRALKEAGTESPGHPDGLMPVVVALIIAVLAAVPWILWRAGWHVQVHGDRLWPLRGIVLSVSVAACAIFESALIDWALIRPPLRGTLGNGALPCQKNAPGRTANWGLLTRLWLGHRLTTYVLTRVAIGAVITFGAAALVPVSHGKKHSSEFLSQPTAAIIGAVASAVLIFFINRLLPVFSLVSNPRLEVGDRVVLAEEFGTGVSERPVYYVVDVAFEGIKLLELDTSGLPRGAAGRDPGREHDRSLSLTDVPRLLRVRGNYSGCSGLCSRTSHYCPHNFACPVSVPPPKPQKKKKEENGDKVKQAHQASVTESNATDEEAA